MSVVTAFTGQALRVGWVGWLVVVQLCPWACGGRQVKEFAVTVGDWMVPVVGLLRVTRWVLSVSALSLSQVLPMLPVVPAFLVWPACFLVSKSTTPSA